MKRNRRKPNPDLAADLMAAFMALCLVGSLTLTTLFIYTWCRPTVSSLQSPVSRLSQHQEVR